MQNVSVLETLKLFSTRNILWLCISYFNVYVLLKLLTFTSIDSHTQVKLSVIVVVLSLSFFFSIDALGNLKSYYGIYVLIMFGIS